MKVLNGDMSRCNPRLPCLDKSKCARFTSPSYSDRQSINDYSEDIRPTETRCPAFESNEETK